MTSRERVLAAVGHRNKGRIPFSISSHGSLAIHGRKLFDMLCRYPGDFYDPKTLRIPDMAELKLKLKTTDKWGCEWETADPLITGAVTKHPLADWNHFPAYKMPQIPEITQKDIDNAEKTRETYPVWAAIDHFFQIMENLRGAEQLYMDFYLQPEELRKLIDRLLNENHVPLLEENLKLKPDIVAIGDDLGTQTSLIINPALWHEFLKPVYKRMADIAHQAGAKVWFHSCGYTREILDGLIEAGVDIINPQMPVMNHHEYGEAARNRITICPDLDRQNILMKGSPSDVKKHIIDMYDALGTPSGGLIGFVPIEPDMPLDNVEAMLQTVSSYGRD